MKLRLALVALLALVAPAASAQDEPDLAIRPFVFGTIQGF